MKNWVAGLAQYLSINTELLAELQKNQAELMNLAAMATSMAEVLASGDKLLVCGNGGSLCQATHFAEELTGRYRKDRAPLPVIALADASHITCVGNDYGFDQIFSRSIDAYGKPGDGVLILSTSGNSNNVLLAAEAAKRNQLQTYALLGKGGGQLKGMCEYELIVGGETSDAVQNIHMILIHCLIETIERQLFPENY